jgi:hypothetical protein
MNENRPQFSCLLIFAIILSAFLLSTTLSAQTYTAVDQPLESTFQVKDISYSYNPVSGTLTKIYKFQNVSGETKVNPLLFNLFLWSNNITTADWGAMSYNNITHIYSNDNQTATASDNDGYLDWSSSVAYSIDNSTALFPSLVPVQSIQSSTEYPYWRLPSTWLDGDNATVQIQFSNVLNCNWIQNMVWFVLADCPGDYDCDNVDNSTDNCLQVYNQGQQDTDSDNYGDECDNCVNIPNSPGNGTCSATYSGVVVGKGIPCTDNSPCGTGTCQMNQEDYNGNNIGDACECYADLSGDHKINSADLLLMKTDYNRSNCSQDNLCLADITKNGSVNSQDLLIMKVQYNKSNCP